MREAVSECPHHFSPHAAADGSVDPDVRDENDSTLLGAWARLRESFSSGADPSQLAELERGYEERVERDIIAPAVQAALGEPDPQLRALLQLSAELNRLRHPLATRVTEMVLALQSTRTADCGRPFPSEPLRAYLSTVDRFLAVAREIERGRSHRRHGARRRSR